MNTPSICALRNHFPYSRFVLVSSKKNKDLVTRYKWFDQVYFWDNKMLNFLPLITRLRKCKPDLSVILHANFPYDILSAVVSGSAVIFRDHYGKELPILNKYLDNYSGYYDGHTIKRKLKLVEGLGIIAADTHMHLPESTALPSRVGGQCRVGFQLGASKDIRRWPVERFVDVACSLIERQPNTEIVITGTASEQHLENDFLALIPAEFRNNIVGMSGKTTLNGLIDLIRTLDVLVTGDTGPMHIAIAAQIQTVSLFSTANPRHTGPCQQMDKHLVIYRPADVSQCSHPMNSISAPEVTDAICTLLNKVAQ